VFEKFKDQHDDLLDCLGTQKPPLVSYYTDDPPKNFIGPQEGFDIKIRNISDAVAILFNFNNLLKKKEDEHHCMFEYIMETRKTGVPSVFNYDNFGCLGFRFYSGYIEKLPVFNHYFVSTGIPGIYPGERFVARPKSAKHAANKLEGRTPKAKNLVFSRFDKLDREENIEVVTFVDNPEIITGLIGLVRFATDADDAVRAIYCSGCSSVFGWPAQLQKQGKEQAVLGVWDLAARPRMDHGDMTIAISFNLFKKILSLYKQSFVYKQKKYKGKEGKDVVFSWRDGRCRAMEYEKIMSQLRK
jgi:hypothetical protein